MQSLLRLAAMLVLAANQTLAAQRAAQPVFSLGQPPIWLPHAFAGASFSGRSDASASLAIGVRRYLSNPVTGLLAATGEAYATMARAGRPGVRLMASTPALGLSAGVDWGSGGNGLATILSFETAVRRGGLLGHGTMLRVDWLPRRSAMLNVGLRVPLGEPRAGRTRPRDTDADLPAPPASPAAAAARASLDTRAVLARPVEAALTRVGYAAANILAYTNLFADDTAIFRYGRSYTVAVRSYREEMEQAFAAAAAGDAALGAGLAARARANLLDAVLLPYDALFGQVKQGGIRPLTEHAQALFTDWLRDSSRVAPERRAAVAIVHARWLMIVEAVQANLQAQWRDSRLVWLPLQLALGEDQYDEQTEVDALIEGAVSAARGTAGGERRQFTDRNALTYLRSSDLPLEIARSIFATRDYHVLWTHDFTGRRDISKTVDDVAYTMVADAYLPALTQAVARYDTSGRMPVYIVMLDDFYYEKRDGRLWMDMLEDPLHAAMRLPPGNGNAARETHLRERQEALRRAVASSARLRREAAVHGGNEWLRRVVKVHVNILLPADFSFRSHRIMPGIPFVPDNVQRDHRKLAFYDLNEADPYRGEVILMGVGIGEHYSSATWEDRGYRVRGPAALEVRAAARRALLRNGMRVDQLPPPLRAASGEPAQNAGEEYVGRALQVHNEVGFGPKESSVARAMLYNLAPPGSVIIVPDPLWVSDTWAAMLAGAAARGCRVFVISPSLANGPNPQPAVAAIQHDVMLRLLDVSHRLRQQIAASGGELRVGLYTARAEVTDLVGRRREIRQGLERAPWIRGVIPFDSATLAVLNVATTRTEANGDVGTSMAHDVRPRAPQLHQKTQLIARPGAIAALVRQRGWDRVLASAMEGQARQAEKFADQMHWTTPDVDSAATRTADAMIRGYEQSLTPAERKAVSFYFTMGTQNQDPRGLMQDGEASIVVSGIHAAMGLVDLYYIMARSTWIDSKSQLDALLPRPKGLQTRFARLLRPVL